MGEISIDAYCWVWTENLLGILQTHDYRDHVYT